MATTHYNFPTITGTDTIDGVNAINGLANSVDAALYGVQGQIPEGYSLPIAGTTSLGGVRGAGQIAVNPTTGDMSITPNSVTSEQFQDSSITGAKIATSSIDSAQLSSSVLQQINQGTSAYAQNAAAPRIYGFDPYNQQGNMTAGVIYSNYVVSDACNMVTAKLALSGCAFNFAGGNTSTENQLATVGVIPQQYRPTTNFDSLCFVIGGNPNGVCLIYATINASGELGLYHTNYNIGNIPNTSGVYGTGLLCWYYGGVQQS